MGEFLKVAGLIIIAIGIICIYDARKITKKFFSKSDINSAVKSFKIVGFMISIIGSVLVII